MTTFKTVCRVEGCDWPADHYEFCPAHFQRLPYRIREGMWRATGANLEDLLAEADDHLKERARA